MAFQAKIRMNKSGPLTHSGRGGRVIKKGQTVMTTDPEEAAYYQTIAGFTVTVVKGKMTARKPPVEEPDEVEDDDDDDDAEDDDASREEEVGDVYDKADLKKMTGKDLVQLISDDDELPLSKKDVKGLKKSKIIDAIMGAQGGDDADDEDDEDDED